MEKKSWEEPDERLWEQFDFRPIHQEEAEEAADIEQICFPPNEACSRKMMKERIGKAPELFFVAIDRQTGTMAGILTGLATNEYRFRDEFFTDADLHDPQGKNIFLLSLAVRPQYQRMGLARELMYQYLRMARERGTRIVLLTCLAPKVKMYEKMGFQDQGISNSSWGAEQWHEMSFVFS